MFFNVEFFYFSIFYVVTGNLTRQMAEYFNQKTSIPGKIPSGLFNAVFGFQSGSWVTDAGSVKNLAFDGCSIILFSVHIDRYPLVLSDEVRDAVPSSWDPAALAR